MSDDGRRRRVLPRRPRSRRAGAGAGRFRIPAHARGAVVVGLVALAGGIGFLVSGELRAVECRAVGDGVACASGHAAPAGWWIWLAGAAVSLVVLRGGDAVAADGTRPWPSRMVVAAVAGLLALPAALSTLAPTPPDPVVYPLAALVSVAALAAHRGDRAGWLAPMTLAVATVLSRQQATGPQGGVEWLLSRNLGLALGCLAAALVAGAFAALWTHLDRQAQHDRTAGSVRAE